MGSGPIQKADPRLSFLGIVTALPEEATCLAGRRAKPESLLTLSESVRLQLSGLGRERAASAARGLVEQGAVALMSWGTVAGLVPELRAGDLVIPRKVIGAEGPELLIDADWHRRLCAALSEDPQSSPVAEATEVLVDVESKARLGKLTGAVATDMESAAIARVAIESGLSSVIMRVVVDPVSMVLPSSAMAAVSASGARDWWGLCRGVARRPNEMVALCRLASALSAAQRTLTRVARSVGPEFLAFDARRG